MNAKELATALLVLKRERDGAGRVLDKEQPRLAKAIDEVLRTWRASMR